MTNIITLSSETSHFAGFIKKSGLLNKYTDFMISIKDAEGNWNDYPVHRIVMENHSDFFSAMLEHDYVESRQSRLNLTFIDERRVFPLLTEFMYHGKVTMQVDQLIPLLQLSEYLQCNELASHIKTHFDRMFKELHANSGQDDKNIGAAILFSPKKSIVRKFVILLKDAVHFSLNEMADKILDHLAPVFDLIELDQDKSQDSNQSLFSVSGWIPVATNELLKILSFKQFHHLVSHPQLSVSSEFKRFLWVDRFVTLRTSSRNTQDPYQWSEQQTRRYESSMNQSQDDAVYLPGPKDSFGSNESLLLDDTPLSNLSLTHIVQLFSIIDWKALELNELEIASQSRNLPSSILIQGLLAVLKSSITPKYERQKTADSKTSKAKQERFKELTFTHVSDFDTNGIVYYFGTNGGTSTLFTNPSYKESQRILCTMSSNLIGKPENILSRQKSPTCTRSQTQEFIMFDFGSSVMINPNAYTLMHGSPQSKCELTDWIFEGSLTGSKDWEMISIHKNQKCLKGAYQTATFALHATRFYRYFRIRSIEACTFIQVSGFEIYGTLKIAF